MLPRITPFLTILLWVSINPGQVLSNYTICYLPVTSPPPPQKEKRETPVSTNARYPTALTLTHGHRPSSNTHNSPH